MSPADLMHRGLERAAGPLRRPRTPSGPATTAGPSRDLDGLGQRLRPPPARPRASRPGDRVAVMTDQPGRVRRRRPRHQQARRRRRPAQPGVEGGRGRPRPRRSPAPVHAVADGAGRRRCSPSGSAPSAVTDLDDAATSSTPRRRTPARSAAGVADDRRGGPRVQLGHHRAAQGGAPHPPLDRARHRPLGAAPRARPRRPLPGRHAAVAHPRPAQPAGRGRGRRHRAPAPPLRPRRGAAPHRVRPHHPRDGGGADRPGHGRTTRDLERLRPLVAPLHHVGRHAGDRERGRGRHRAHRRAVAARPTAPASCR